MEGFRENEVHSLNGLHLTALWQFVWTRERLEMMIWLLAIAAALTISKFPD